MLRARRERPHLGAGVGTGRSVCPGWVRDVVAGSIEPMDPLGMRRLLLAPWWVLALYYVVLFRGLIGVFPGSGTAVRAAGSSPASSEGCSPARS